MNFNEAYKGCANDMQYRAQMKGSKCAKDILKCANEKRRFDHHSNKIAAASIMIIWIRNLIAQ